MNAASMLLGHHMTVRIVRLGTKRVRGEGLRIRTVTRPPRGVPRREYSAQNWYDMYCEDESRCHRSVLRALLKEPGAKAQ
jgi:uncharacterized protein YeaO (DUF488 family)